MNHDRRLLGFGGVNLDGAHWRISQDQAIVAIETGRWSFYIEADGRELLLVVVVSRYGSKYIKSVGDGLQPDSLLALPDCR